MDHVVTHVLPWKTQIRKRDVHFFQDNKHIFEGLPSDRVEYYSEKLSKDIDEESRNVMWEFFDTMVELAERYKKYKWLPFAIFQTLISFDWKNQMNNEFKEMV